RRALRHVDSRGRRFDARAHLLAGLVVADRGEEVHLAGRPRQLEEGDASAAAGKRPHVFRVRDVAGTRHLRYASQRDVLHVPDDCDAHPRHTYQALAARATLPARRAPAVQGNGGVSMALGGLLAWWNLVFLLPGAAGKAGRS